MTDNEQVEYQGLAAAVGRVTMALKRTEDALTAALLERDELAARLVAAEPTHAKNTKSTKKDSG